MAGSKSTSRSVPAAHKCSVVSGGREARTGEEREVTDNAAPIQSRLSNAKHAEVLSSITLEPTLVNSRTTIENGAVERRTRFQLHQRRQNGGQKVIQTSLSSVQVSRGDERASK